LPILEPNLWLLPPASMIKQKLIVLIYIIFI